MYYVAALFGRAGFYKVGPRLASGNFVLEPSSN